ncbi:Crp/Fnr family transcriptional regulator [Chitinophaga tropicalis]|uniref:Cyclic nucleotide-binding domain-containing protein n=1 Tax=Chitinophaga tropicalis TaxID=2683588 RepID=A0A7K1UBH1_9BACT|nr:Crp/Fnr family transcriptional regulator [Chitinophaga tropicalis]MVT11739.1 cyclic nucleotide-binding domain-containing protein [Chitinophaga tropicalis]
MKKGKLGCDLHTCMLCNLCLPAWKPAIAANKQNFSLKKGQLLFQEGDPVQGIYFINSGKVKVHKHWGDEKELIVRFAREGDIVGHRGVGSEMVYPVSATALEAVELCYIDLDFFRATLKVNNDFLHALMMFYASELQESEKNMRNLVHMPVKGRIANALLTLQKKFGIHEDGSINMTLSRQDLASYTGTTYETAFRVMSELTQDKIITINGKNIAVTDVEKLQQLVQEVG